MSKQFFDITVSISVLSAVIPIIIYVLKFKSHPRQNHFIGAFLLITFLLDILILGLQLFSISTIVYNNLFSMVSLITLAAFYREIIFKHKAKVIFTSIVGLFIISTIYFSTFNPFVNPLVYYWAINALLIAVLSLLYISLLPSMTIERFLDRYLYSNFAISLSISFYFIGATIIFCFAGFVFTHLTTTESRIFWTSHNIISLFKNLGIAAGLFLTGKRNPYISLTVLESMTKNKV